MSVPQEAAGALLDAAANVPLVPIRRLAPGPVLVLAPHPDDETLGCGMALAAAARTWRGTGPAALVLQLTDGAGSHPGSLRYPPRELAALRHREMLGACRALGGDRIAVAALGLEDASLRSDQAHSIAQHCLATLGSFVPAAIWTTWDGDPHCDHEAGAAAAGLIARATGAPLWSYAVWGRFGKRRLPEPALYRFDDAAARERKREAALAHASQFTALIDDAPDAFRMPAVLLDHFLDTPEIFIAGEGSRDEG